MIPQIKKTYNILFSILIVIALILCSIIVITHVYGDSPNEMITRQGILYIFIVWSFSCIYGILSYVLTRRLLIPFLILGNIYAVMHILCAMFDKNMCGWVLPEILFRACRIINIFSLITFALFKLSRIIIKRLKLQKVELFSFPIKDTVLYGISALSINGLVILTYYGLNFMRKILFFRDDVLAYNNGTTNTFVNITAVIILVFGFTSICSAQFNDISFDDFIKSFWIKTKKRIYFVSVVAVCFVLTIFGMFSNRTVLTENGIEHYGMFGSVVEKIGFEEISYVEFDVGTKVLTPIAANSNHLFICIHTENKTYILDDIDLFQLPSTIELCLEKADVKWHNTVWQWSVWGQSSYGVSEKYREELENMMKEYEELYRE